MKVKIPNGIDQEGRPTFNEVEIKTEEAKLLVTINKLKEALEFYAKRKHLYIYDNNYVWDDEDDQSDDAEIEGYVENGYIARKALKECGL